MIVVENLQKSFFNFARGEVYAVDGLSFSCPDASIYGLIGPNGAGKTTTLRIVATILRPTSGTVRVGLNDVEDDPDAVRRQLGYLSTSTATYDRMTPEEMVRHFGQLHGMADDKLDSQIEKLFDLLKMNDFRSKLIGRLSTGMKQKVSFARTIVHDPPVVVLDEPTAGLDIMVSRTVIDFIQSLKQQGRTILLSTHIMSEARKLCDKIGIIHQGKLIAEGTHEELSTRFGCNELEDIFFAAVEAATPENENNKAV